MDLDPSDLLQSFLLFDGSYEDRVLSLLEALLTPGGYFVDVGANIGLHSLVASRRVGPKGLVDAIEPEPATRARLEAHIALNDCSNVRVFEYALSNHSGIEELHVSPSGNRGKNSLHPSNVTLGLDEPSPGSIPVSTRTLDEHLAGQSRAPDLIKIDVEGAELLVIEGGRDVLSRREAPIILFEASELLTGPFGYSTTDLKARLLTFGYDIFRYAEARLAPVSRDEVHRLEDLVALKPEHRARVTNAQGELGLSPD